MWTELQQHVASDTSTHDVGFMVGGPYLAGLRMSPQGSPWHANYSATVIEGAHSLSKRFVPAVGMTRSWGKIGSPKVEVFAPMQCTRSCGVTFCFPSQLCRTPQVIIDNLMNLEIMFWAAANGGAKEKPLLSMAESHVRNTAKYWIRKDGSTPHLCKFDAKSGKLLSPCVSIIPMICMAKQRLIYIFL